MPAWFLLPAAVSAIGAIGKYKGAAARSKAIEGLKPSKDSFKANTGYLKKYISDLRGRSSSRARTELAMRPALRAIGQQQGQAQRQLSYSAAQQGLAGSGIEAQKRLSLQQAGMQQAARVGETVGYSELNKARALQQQREGQEMKATMQIGQMEGAAEQRFQEATRQWQGQLAGAEAAKTGAMWEGISDVTGSLVGNVGGHFQKIGQQKKFLDFLINNPDMSPEMMAQYQGLQDGGIVDYFKQSTGVQGAFDAETKRRQKEYDQSVLDYEKAKSAEFDEFKELQGSFDTQYKDEYEKIESELDDVRYDQIKASSDYFTNKENKASRRIKRKNQRRRNILEERETKLEAEKKEISWKKDNTSKLAEEKMGESKLTAPEEFTGLSPEDSTKILKKHLLEGMNAGVFTKEGLISGYTKHRAKKEMSSFMSQVGTMTDADFWSHPYAMNNPQAAVRIYDAERKKRATQATADLKLEQETANLSATDNWFSATNTPDDLNTPENETLEALQAAKRAIEATNIKGSDYKAIVGKIQTSINNLNKDQASNKKLAAKWGEAKSNSSIAMMTGVDGAVVTGIMDILNKEGNIEGMTTADYQEIEGIVRKRIAAIASAEGATNVFSDKGLDKDMAILFELLKPESKESKEVKILQGVLKKVNNSEFRREDGVEVQDEVDSGEPIMVNSAEDFNKLPSGTVFIDPNGEQRTKP